MTDQLSTDLASLRINREETQPRSRVWSTLLILALILGSGGAGYYFYSPRLKARLFKTEVSLTEIMNISPSQESVQLTASGYVVPQILSKVATKLQGRVAQVFIKEGDKVKAGDPLLKLEDIDQKASLEAAQKRVLASQASAEASRANLAEVRQQADRQKILTQRGVSSRAAADDLNSKVDSLDKAVRAAEAQIKVSQAEVSSLKVNLQQYLIKAPINGVVISKPPSLGDLVGPGQGEIIELADMNSLMVETDVPEARLHLVRKGSPGEVILDAYPTQRYRGEVQEIGWRVNRSKATIVVKVKFVDSREGVLPDMAARVSFLSKPLDEKQMKEPSQIIVPSAAVTERAGAKVVFIYEEGKVRLSPVTLGPAYGNGFVLKDGPPPGTKVIKNPSDIIADGLSVKERND